MGSMTAWLKSILETAVKWSDDPEPAVSRWAKKLVLDLVERSQDFRSVKRRKISSDLRIH